MKQSILSFLTSLFITVSAFAQVHQVHEIQVAPGADEAPIALEGWLIPSGRSYSVTLTARPFFGNFMGETYFPGESVVGRHRQKVMQMT